MDNGNCTAVVHGGCCLKNVWHSFRDRFIKAKQNKQKREECPPRWSVLFKDVSEYVRSTTT